MKCIVYLLLTLSLLRAHAQQPDLVFHHLTQKDGLSYNIINCFLKDSRGMLWIGTYNGLNRYDGSHFYVFRKGKDQNSLPNNTIHKLAEDKHGNIWGATDNGIFCYDQGRNSFKNYQTPGRKNWPVIPAIICDQQGTVWACNGSSLVRYNANIDSFEMAPLNITDGKTAPFLCRKNGLAESPDGKGLWLACREGFIYYDKMLQRFISTANSNDSVLYAAGSASALCATNFGHYWYFDNANKRLVGFDAVKRTLKYIIDPKEFLSIGAVATVFEDNNHLIWLCTWNYELFTIDYRNGAKVNRIQHHDNDRSSIAGDFFWCAMQDNDGTLWLGTVGGISRCNINQSFYKIHRFKDSLFASSNPAIESIAENKYDSSWWVSTNEKKLLRYDAATSKVSSYYYNTMPANKMGLGPGNANKMLFFKTHLLLFSNNGTWIKQNNGAFKVFTWPSLPDSVILKDAAMPNDSVVYCTDYKRVWKWDTHTGNITEMVYQQAFTIHGERPTQLNLTRGANNKVWMLNGYDYISYADGKNLVPLKYSLESESLGTGYYNDIVADKKGDLWIAKKAVGLINYKTTEKKTIQYNQYDGLVMDHVMAVTIDASNKIWTAAYNQFSVFDPLLNSFYNFTLPLSENNYAYINHMATLANGHVICNIANQIVEFFPDRLKAYSINTQPLISTLSIAGTEKLLQQDAIISLAANENSFLLKFGLLADNEASPYMMQYILEGAEKNWTIAGSNLEASYNSLAPGNYTFKVKALAKDKNWQTKETILKINIATPFYKSWWFVGLMAFVIVSAMYLLYRYRLLQQHQVLQLKSKAQLLEKEKATVLYESLKQQLNPHFLFNSLTSLSGLIETDQALAGAFLDQMSKTYRYILKSSDSETVALRDEIAFVKLYIKLQQTRFKNGLVAHINIPEEYDHFKIAPVTLQNMIENAIKHNIVDKSAPLVIDIYIEKGYLLVKNNLQRKNVVETSNKRGLENLQSLYGYLTEKRISIEETDSTYSIKIPLI